MVERLWSAGVSAVKYVLFALFVLGLNRLHQYHRDLSRTTKEVMTSVVLGGNDTCRLPVVAQEEDRIHLSKASSAQTVIPTVSKYMTFVCSETDSEQMLNIEAQLQCTRRKCKTFRPRRPSSVAMHKVCVRSCPTYSHVNILRLSVDSYLGNKCFYHGNYIA